MDAEHQKRREEKPRAGLFVLHIDDLLLFKLLLVAIAITILGWAVIGYLSITNHNQATSNTGRIAKQQRDLAKVEAQDRRFTRLAQWRGCKRDMLERADSYVSTQSVQDIPAFTRIFPQSLIEEAEARRRRSLPILDCDPNMCGRAPTILPARDQRLFVKAFEEGLLDPNPVRPIPPIECRKKRRA